MSRSPHWLSEGRLPMPVLLAWWRAAPRPARRRGPRTARSAPGTGTTAGTTPPGNSTSALSYWNASTTAGTTATAAHPIATSRRHHDAAIISTAGTA
ncbi:hypothetical protein [Lentzea guizhouensis]|uniref:hypothetical protein n=1 Tax=Lentzea guizhouensis TaxID=1586287 RepID=UPI0012B692C3|nr:hypothetical protein [Lentzea guizhouensis]